MHKVHITLEELQAVALMLDRMAFSISSKVIALHWIIKLQKHIYVIQVVQCLFLSRLGSYILNLADKHSITLIAVYIPNHLNVECNYLS